MHERQSIVIDDYSLTLPVTQVMVSQMFARWHHNVAIATSMQLCSITSYWHVLCGYSTACFSSQNNYTIHHTTQSIQNA